MTLLFLAALAAGVVSFILFPVFARYAEVSRLPTAEARERKTLSEQKERLYDAIKDVDFEYRAGKLSDADYQSVRSDLVSQAAAVISRLDELPEAAETATPVQPPQEAARATKPEVSTPSSSEEAAPAEGLTCSSCQQVNPPEAKFCLSCGERMAAPASCPECGTELPKEARFCISCGVTIPA